MFDFSQNLELFILFSGLCRAWGTLYLHSSGLWHLLNFTWQKSLKNIIAQVLFGCKPNWSWSGTR